MAWWRISHFLCPDNGKKYQIFGESHIEAIAQAHKMQVLAKLPIDRALSEACDNGSIESYSGSDIEELCNTIEKRK